MPSLHVSRVHRPQTAPERDFEQDPPSFMPTNRTGGHRRSATDGQAQNGLHSAGRRFSAAALLDQNRLINSARHFRQRSSSSAGLPPPGSNSDHRLGNWNTWLPQTASSFSTDSIKQFVAERKASVQSVAHKIRPSSRRNSFIPLTQTTPSRPAGVQNPVFESSAANSDQTITEASIKSLLNIAPEFGSSKRWKQNKTLGTSDAAHSSRTHLLSATDPDSLWLQIPKADTVQDVSWISELKATSPFDDPFDDLHSSADPYRLRRARRHSWLGDTDVAKVDTQRDGGERQRRPSAPALFDSTVEVLRPPVSKMTPLTPTSEGAQTKRLSGQSASSWLHPAPAIRPSLRLHSRAGKRLSQISHYGSGSDQLRSEQHDDDSESHHILDITDHQTLQMRIMQLENELRMSRCNTDIWMSRYGVLAATKNASNKEDQPKQQRTKEDAESERSRNLSVPPHQKKPRRLTSFEKSIRSEREGVISPTNNATDLDQPLPPSTDLNDVDVRKASRMNSYRSDDSAGTAPKQDEPVSPPPAILTQKERPDSDSEPAPLLRPLSVCEQIDYLADGGREGIDAVTLNSLMPEDGSGKRQRSGSATNGITQMAAGWKAKLRSGKAGERLSPAGSQSALPPMPLKSPNRPTVKLFGRRSFVQPSIKEDSSSVLVSSPNPMKGSDISSVHGFSLHPPGEPRGTNGSPTPAQALAADYGRHRSSSVVSKLSINTLQSATRRVSSALGPTMKGKGGALRLSGIGTSGAASQVPSRTITTGMIGSPVLVASPDHRADVVDEAPDAHAHRRSIATTRSAAPDWLESIAMDTSSSDENEDSQEAVQEADTHDQSTGLSSALASSTILSQYVDNSIPLSLSKNSTNRPLPESSTEHRLDHKPLPEIRDVGAEVHLPAEVEEDEKEELGNEDDERLLPGKPQKTPHLHTPAYTPSVSTVSSLKTHNHEPRPPVGGAEDGERPSQDLGLEQFSFLVAEVPSEGMATVRDTGSILEPSNTQNERVSAPASSPEMGSSGAQSFAEASTGDEPNMLQIPGTTSQRGLVSTRTSNRSSTSLRNRLARTGSFVPHSASPISQSSRRMGSHDVHTSVPQSPGPPSPSLTPSPKDKELPEILAAEHETGDPPRSPNKTAIPKRRTERAVASMDDDLKPDSTPGSSRSNLLRKFRPSLIPRKSAATMKSSTSDLGGQSESGQGKGDKLDSIRPSLPKSSSYSNWRKPQDRNVPDAGDTSWPVVMISKQTPAPAAAIERPVSKDGVQALALDWLHAHTLVEQGFEAMDADDDDSIQAADESRASSKIPVRSQAIGNSLSLHMAPTKGAPAVPSKIPTPLYAHITPPGSDAG